jgi:hypothetical protein
VRRNSAHAGTPRARHTVSHTHTYQQHAQQENHRGKAIHDGLVAFEYSDNGLDGGGNEIPWEGFLPCPGLVRGRARRDGANTQTQALKKP